MTLALTVAILAAAQCASMCILAGGFSTTQASGHSHSEGAHGHAAVTEPCAPEHKQPQDAMCGDHAVHVFTVEKSTPDLTPSLTALYLASLDLAVPLAPDMLAAPRAWSGSPPGALSVITLTTVLRI